VVKTTSDVLDINPLERMDKLKEIRSEKKKSLADKRKELEELERNTKIEIESLENRKRKELNDLENKKNMELEELDVKRKELRDLESKKVKEIEETQELIEQSFQDLMRNKRILLQEEDNKKKSEEYKAANLEDIASAAKNIMPQEANVNYHKFFENLQTPQRFYDVNNTNFYNGLTELRNKAARGEITSEEEMFVDQLRRRLEQFSSNDSYIEQDQNQYLRRSMNVIEQMGTYKRMKID
jgi:hypothetical protein